MRRALSAAAVVIGFLGASAVAAPTRLACTNTFSGKQWSYTVDWAKSTVNRRPAVITDSQITWQDTDVGPNYNFNRSSGVMMKVVASSTGGGILYDRCVLQ